MIEEIEQVLLHSRSLNGMIYEKWITLPQYKKERFRGELRNIIRQHLLDEELRKALAKDVYTEDGINVQSYLFLYLKNRVYHGDVRRLLGDLKELI